MSKKSDEVQPIIIKKIKKGGGGHHGGAWKVAYADFVTAMMAFFLLLWLLNVTTKEAQNEISNYFAPTDQRIAESLSGAGGIMGGQTISPDGAMTSQTQPLTAPQQTGQAGTANDQNDNNESEVKKLEEELKQREDQRFEEAEKELKKEIEGNPELKELTKNLLMDITPEGLRIQIVDQDGQPMFPSGSAEMYEKTRKLLATVAKVITPMPNDLSVRGHTDSVNYAVEAKYTNWELSADRANSSRRVLANAGVPPKRLANVMGKADREHLFPENPSDPRNRRISIILLREDVGQALKRGEFGEDKKKLVPAGPSPKKPSDFQKTPGAVYFP